MPEIELYLRPQIGVLVLYLEDFQEVNSGGPKVEPIHYPYWQTNKQMRHTVKLPHW